MLSMANLQVRQPFGLASSFVGLAKSRADVIAVSELTAEEVQEFSRVGIEEPFPHSLLKPAPGAGGIGLWSRYPLVTVPPAKHPGSAIASAQVQIPNVRFSPLVASVHITSPVTAEAGSFDRWRNGIADIQTNLGHFAEKAGPAAVIIAGDFNSTPDVRQIRDLLANGYRDAVEQTGAGFAPTFPSNKWFPPCLLSTTRADPQRCRLIDPNGGYPGFRSPQATGDSRSPT